MQRYLLFVGGKSSVEVYKIGETYIAVKFKNTSNKMYTYSYSLAGKNNVDTMKNLASVKCGLNSCIMKNVKDLYDR
jgi:hypothetical protein